MSSATPTRRNKRVRRDSDSSDPPGSPQPEISRRLTRATTASRRKNKDSENSCLELEMKLESVKEENTNLLLLAQNYLGESEESKAVAEKLKWKNNRLITEARVASWANMEYAQEIMKLTEELEKTREQLRARELEVDSLKDGKKSSVADSIHDEDREDDEDWADEQEFDGTEDKEEYKDNYSGEIETTNQEQDPTQPDIKEEDEKEQENYFSEVNMTNQVFQPIKREIKVEEEEDYENYYSVNMDTANQELESTQPGIKVEDEEDLQDYYGASDMAGQELEPCQPKLKELDVEEENMFDEEELETEYNKENMDPESYQQELMETKKTVVNNVAEIQKYIVVYDPKRYIDADIFSSSNVESVNFTDTGNLDNLSQKPDSYNNIMFILVDNSFLHPSNRTDSTFENLMALMKQWKGIRADAEIHTISWINVGGRCGYDKEIRLLFDTFESRGVCYWKKDVLNIIGSKWLPQCSSLLSEKS